MQQTHFLSEAHVRELASEHGTPLFVYSKKVLETTAQEVAAAMRQLPFGHTLRFAMKANPHPELLELFTKNGVHIDASSSYEAELALESGVPASNILLTSQQLPPSDKAFKTLISTGVQFTATSLHQLETYCRLFPGSDVSLRVNPGMGSGMNNRLTTGGVSASFGLWYEYIPEALAMVKKANVTITRLHTHIGTGTDPAEWEAALDTTLHLAEQLPDVTTLDIGGGFKAAYMPGDHDADMEKIMQVLASRLQQFAEQHDRKLHLEIEPGRLLSVKAGVLIAKVIDVTDTGEQGYTFVRCDTGMNDILRPAMYGAQHPLSLVPAEDEPRETKEVVVVGHCCESSDTLTTAKGNPEELEPREMLSPRINDYIVIECAGAYCANMRAKGYNSYPDAQEILIN